ncbi:ribosome small subunit-dependent GTPase A [Mycoplasma sp. Pen4]|uniref:ribosome small subunit-dependent GTPase A n=1 Tax=Mycoplasma sp. Pen4 TaxID=640330 RepID=UPI001654232C|nr:ribosome small subunit-dependent GTPase A [Mycoplasma sp. Pen4]QNM93405.1 ribosome small subunit-dependent GTPase A [Mycoplasma sp. Pen4]
MQNSNTYKILSVNAGIFTVRNENEELKIPAAGKLRFRDEKPIVGDNVIVTNGQITEILDRRNFFIRPKVANIDQMIVFMSSTEPAFSSFLVDKYFAIVENKNIEPILFITKVDLDNPTAIEMHNLYSEMGYKVFLINNEQDNFSFENIKHIFKNKYSVFMGQTGVGKTTTLNKLSNNNFETQAISKALGRGKHTTRIVQIIYFNEGFLIDTPGFSSLALDMNKVELAQSFKTFNTLSKQCKFRNCLHLNESNNDCAVKQKVGTPEIPTIRYNNYVKLLSELD